MGNLVDMNTIKILSNQWLGIEIPINRYVWFINGSLILTVWESPQKVKHTPRHSVQQDV